MLDITGLVDYARYSDVLETLINRLGGKADDILLKYINDPDITEAFNRWDKWYA